MYYFDFPSRRGSITVPDTYRKFKVYWRDEVVATVDLTSNNDSIIVLTDRINKLPFKKNSTRKEVLDFLAERCFPSERANKNELLDALGLKEYNHLEIIRKTHGVDFDDFLWIKFEDDPEDLSWEDVKVR